MMYGLMNNNFFDNYNPFREMESFEHNLFPAFFGHQDLATFKTDLSDQGDHFLLEADLPGFDKKDINLELRDGVLTIRAERHGKQEQEDEKSSMIRQERSYGSYSRQFDMSGVDVDHISASYENGVLQLKLPKVQEKAPEVRKLEIA